MFHSMAQFEDIHECRRTIRKELKRLYAQGKRRHSVPSWHWDNSKGYVFSLEAE